MAAQQGTENRDTALFNTNINRADQVGPQGSVTWTLKPGADPNNPQAGDYIQTTTYSPEQQALYDKTTGISNSFLDTAQSGLSRVQDGLGNAFDTSQLPQMQTLGAPQLTAPQGLPNRSVQGPQPGAQVSWNGLPNQTVSAGPETQKSFETAALQMGLDTSKLAAMPTGGDEASRRRVEEAMLARFNPDMARQEEAMRTKLLQSGLTVGSDAWNREMARMDQARNDARMQAVLAGGQEESRQVGLQQGLRQQGFGELVTGGQFANSAQQQDYLQKMGLAGLNNQGLAQDLQSQLSAGGFNNQAALQQLQGNASVAGFNNATQQQDFQAALAAAGFGNNATMQQNQQTQGYEQLLAALTQSQAGFNNQARQQSIQEQAYLRSLPMNEINALRTGSQVTGPQFGSYYTGASAGAAPIFDAGMAKSSWDQNQYNQQMNSWNSAFGALTGAGTTAATMFLSDARLKSNIKRIGTLPNGIDWYSYEIFGAPQFGVLAQEVQKTRPDAVVEGQDGFLRVDYSKVAA